MRQDDLVEQMSLKGNGVTVLIAAYNAADTLPRALDSVLAQTMLPEQILVVDDGSKDATADVAKRFAGRGVEVLQQPNGGVSRARNHGLQKARGEFIAFLDADDWWMPEKLAQQVSALEQDPKRLATYTGLQILDSETGSVKVQPPTDAKSLWPQLRWTNPFIPPSSVMMRRSALEEAGGFNEGIEAGEDWELWIKIARRDGFVTTPEPVTCYQIGSSGLSGNAKRVYESFLQILDGPLLEGLHGWERVLWRRRLVAFQAYKAALTSRAAGDRQSELRYMRQSFAAWPSPTWPQARLKSAAVTFLRRQRGARS